MTELFFENDCSRFNRMYDFWEEYPLDIESDKPVTVLCSSQSQRYVRDVTAAFDTADDSINFRVLRMLANQLIVELGIPDEVRAVSAITYRVKVLAGDETTKVMAFERFGSASEDHCLQTAMVRVLAELKETR